MLRGDPWEVQHPPSATKSSHIHHHHIHVVTLEPPNPRRFMFIAPPISTLVVFSLLAGSRPWGEDRRKGTQLPSARAPSYHPLKNAENFSLPYLDLYPQRRGARDGMEVIAFLEDAGERCSQLHPLLDQISYQANPTLLQYRCSMKNQRSVGMDVK